MWSIVAMRAAKSSISCTDWGCVWKWERLKSCLFELGNNHDNINFGRYPIFKQFKQSHIWALLAPSEVPHLNTRWSKVFIHQTMCVRHGHIWWMGYDHTSRHGNPNTKLVNPGLTLLSNLTKVTLLKIHYMTVKCNEPSLFCLLKEQFWGADSSFHGTPHGFAFGKPNVVQRLTGNEENNKLQYAMPITLRCLSQFMGL